MFVTDDEEYSRNLAVSSVLWLAISVTSTSSTSTSTSAPMFFQASPSKSGRRLGRGVPARALPGVSLLQFCSLRSIASVLCILTAAESGHTSISNSTSISTSTST